MTYDPTLFESAAPFYAAHRRYPAALYDRLRDVLRADGSGRLLDIATGTGQLAVPLAQGFREVVALDPDQDMLDEAMRAARDARADNIVFVRALAEDLPLGLGTFSAVTIGTALHWMDRERVLETVYDMLEPDGTLVVIGGGDASTYDEPDPRPVIGEIIARYAGPNRRASDGTYAIRAQHQEVIARTRFGAPDVVYVAEQRTQTPEDILGLALSTSFANRRVLGEDAPAFEEEALRALRAATPAGTFAAQFSFDVIVARKPE